MIVPKATTAKALTAFKAWKELIGHRVAIVELPDIDQYYQGIDGAEKIRNFLVDKHEAWGIHYVLLVGDMDERLGLRQRNRIHPGRLPGSHNYCLHGKK